MAASILHSASHPLRPGLLLGRLALAEIVVIGLLALAALTFCPASRGCEVHVANAYTHTIEHRAL